MRWDYLGDHCWEVGYWHIRSWICDNLHINCPTCADAERCHEITKDMSEEEFGQWLESRNNR